MGGDTSDGTAKLLLSNPDCSFQEVTQGWYDNTIAVDPRAGSEVVWAGGVSLFRSDDGGANWGLESFWKDPPGDGRYAHEDQHAIVFETGYGGPNKAGMFLANDGGVFRTNENWRDTVPVVCPHQDPDEVSPVTWEARNTNYATAQFYHGLPLSDGSEYYGGTQDNSALRHASGQAGQIAENNPGGDAGYAVVNGTHRWIGGVLRTFARLEPSPTELHPSEDGANFPFISPFVGDPGNEARVWTGGKQPWRNTLNDPLPNWTRAIASQISWSASVSAIGVSKQNGDIVMMGRVDPTAPEGAESGKIARTTNGFSASTPSWTDVTRPRAGWVSWIAIDPDRCSTESECTAYATYSSFGGSHVFRTDDGGSNWTSIDANLSAVDLYDLIRIQNYVVGNYRCLCLELTGQPAAASHGVSGAGKAVLGSRFVGKDGTTTIPVSVDLTEAVADGAPAALGGYVVRVDFDPKTIALAGATAAGSPPFGTDPVFTEPARAAAQGYARIVSAHGSRSGPTGVVPLFSLRVRELIRGSAAGIRVSIEQLGTTPTTHGVLPIPVAAVTK